MIWEFKPDNDDARTEGERQKRDYQYLVPLYYNNLLNRDGSYTVPEASLGGDKMMKALLAKCVRDGVITLTADVKTYNVCKASYECVQE